eukprot:SAG31_NODE_3162_length_4606_cov_22.721544_2_plen_89_part_00
MVSAPGIFIINDGREIVSNTVVVHSEVRPYHRDQVWPRDGEYLELGIKFNTSGRRQFFLTAVVPTIVPVAKFRTASLARVHSCISKLS